MYEDLKYQKNSFFIGLYFTDLVSLFVRFLQITLTVNLLWSHLVVWINTKGAEYWWQYLYLSQWSY